MMDYRELLKIVHIAHIPWQFYYHIPNRYYRRMMERRNWNWNWNAHQNWYYAHDLAVIYAIHARGSIRQQKKHATTCTTNRMYITRDFIEMFTHFVRALVCFGGSGDNFDVRDSNKFLIYVWIDAVCSQNFSCMKCDDYSRSYDVLQILVLVHCEHAAHPRNLPSHIQFS